MLFDSLEHKVGAEAKAKITTHVMSLHLLIQKCCSAHRANGLGYEHMAKVTFIFIMSMTLHNA